MEPQSWIIGQIIIDMIMVGLLLWVLRARYRKELTWQEHAKIIEQSESILADMKTISQGFEENLLEKREIGQNILDQLDQSLKKAEETYQQLSKLIQKTGSPVSGLPNPRTSPKQTRTSIQALLDKGLSKEEIAQHLGISLAEIDLFINLRPPKGQRSKK